MTRIIARQDDGTETDITDDLRATIDQLEEHEVPYGMNLDDLRTRIDIYQHLGRDTSTETGALTERLAWAAEPS